jgi:hypothetical protein
MPVCVKNLGPGGGICAAARFIPHNRQNSRERIMGGSEVLRMTLLAAAIAAGCVAQSVA